MNETQSDPLQNVLLVSCSQIQKEITVSPSTEEGTDDYGNLPYIYY